jgi:hypothetical protein
MKGLSLSVPVPTLTLYTDASNLVWGAYLEGRWALGLWSPLQQKEHINLLEMKAVHLTLSHFRITLHLKFLVLATDNTTVSEKPGRHSLFQPVFSLQGDSPSLLGTSDSTGSEAYSGSSQCTSRHTVTFSNTSEHGIGITTSNFQCHQSSLGSSSSGSVCYVSEPQTGHFRFSSSRSSSIRWRGNVNLLERNVLLRIPSLPVSFPSSSKGGSGISQDHSYCTGLAKTSLVHRSAASLVCKNNASKSREPTSARMVTLRKGTLPNTQSEIDIFLKTQKPSIIYSGVFMFLEMGLCRSRIEFLVMFEVV